MLFLSNVLCLKRKTKGVVGSMSFVFRVFLYFLKLALLPLLMLKEDWAPSLAYAAHLYVFLIFLSYFSI